MKTKKVRALSSRSIFFRFFPENFGKTVRVGSLEIMVFHRLSSMKHYFRWRTANNTHIRTFQRKFHWKIFSRKDFRVLYILEKKKSEFLGQKYLKKLAALGTTKLAALPCSGASRVPGRRGTAASVQRSTAKYLHLEIAFFFLKKMWPTAARRAMVVHVYEYKANLKNLLISKMTLLHM